MKPYLLTLVLALSAQQVQVSGYTEPVSADADDPAIWVNPKDPAKSVIFGTDKLKGKGGIYAFNLEGKVVQRIENLDRPNNCDVEYGVGGMDLLVVTERLQHHLRIFSIDGTDGRLTDVSGKTDVFTNETDPNQREPMGIGLYKNPKTSKTYAFVSRSKGPALGYLGQYELAVNAGKVDVKPVRTFGAFSGKKEIESVFVDDELGFVYYSDETSGTRRYAVDGLDKELSAPDTAQFKGDQEGIALYATGPGKGFIVCTEQASGNSTYHLYDRTSMKPAGQFQAGIDDTDGIEAISANLGSRFPKGLFVAMNSGPKNFALIDCRRLSGLLGLPSPLE